MHSYIHGNTKVQNNDTISKMYRRESDDEVCNVPSEKYTSIF